MNKLKFTLIGYLVLVGIPLFAQSNLELSIRNQSVNGTNFQFDLYLRNTNAGDLFLGNADFVLLFNSGNFTNPSLSKVGTAPGSNTFVPVTLNSTNQTVTRTNYFNNTSTAAIVDNELIINLNGPTPSDQTAFNSSVAKIDNTANTHRLGTFQISGYNGGVNDLQWKVAGSGLVTQVFILSNTTPFSSAKANLSTNQGLPTFLDLANNTISVDSNFLACDSIRSRMVYQNGVTITDITYQAGISITLLPGFHARQGVNFSAKIVNNCGTSSLQTNEEIVTVSRTLPTETETAYQYEAPTDLATLKVFPNPFVHNTNIEFIQPLESPAQLGLYNLRGQLVISIIKTTNLTKGIHRFQLDAGTLAKGLYLLRLSTPSTIISKKLVIH